MKKILVIDDQYSDRELAKDILEQQNYIVDVASSGKEAIEKLKKDRYDVVLTDLMMPEIDGLQIVKFVKENNYDTEVIVMTAYATIDTAIQAIKLGAYDYFVKPLDKYKISILIKNCIEAHQKKNEVKMLQQKIFNIEKMSMISNLSASIAHQLRNPLFAIASTASYLSEKYQHNEELVKNLRLILDSVAQADNIIYQLLRTTSFDDIKLESIFLNKLILETIKLFEVQFNEKNIKTIYKFLEDIQVLADYSLLQQCLLNIFMNSIEAFDETKNDKIIKIKTFVKKTLQLQRRVNDKPYDKFAYIEIEDNAKGIPEDKIDKVFEPFFTLKKNGTGMGLFFVYQVVVNCFSGDVQIESTLGKGTKIVLVLPST